MMKHIGWILALWFSLILGCEKSSTSSQKQAISVKETNREMKYAKDIYDTALRIRVCFMAAAKVCVSHSEAWGNAIRRRGLDVNTEISKSILKNKDEIEMIRDMKKEMEEQMTLLVSPPDGFAVSHAKMVSVYGSFCSLVNAAVSPSGNYSTYNQNTNRICEEFIKGLDEVKVVTPKWAESEKESEETARQIMEAFIKVSEKKDK